MLETLIILGATLAVFLIGYLLGYKANTFKLNELKLEAALYKTLYLRLRDHLSDYVSEVE